MLAAVRLRQQTRRRLGTTPRNVPRLDTHGRCRTTRLPKKKQPKLPNTTNTTQRNTTRYLPIQRQIAHDRTLRRETKQKSTTTQQVRHATRRTKGESQRPHWHVGRRRTVAVRSQRVRSLQRETSTLRLQRRNYTRNTINRRGSGNWHESNTNNNHMHDVLIHNNQISNFNSSIQHTHTTHIHTPRGAIIPNTTPT